MKHRKCDFCLREYNELKERLALANEVILEAEEVIKEAVDQEEVEDMREVLQEWLDS